ncbi:MAG: hypothetical protein QOJ67_1997 [Acidimicrobiaceae bacterium]
MEETRAAVGLVLERTGKSASMTMTARQADRLDFVRWQIDKLFAARDLHDWSIAEGDQYQALTGEERLLLDAR